LEGRKFRRQFSVGNYILDFYCHEEKLAIELDGAHHFTEEGRQRDEKRDTFILSRGIRTLRIENEKVFKNTSQVLDYIKGHFTNYLSSKTGKSGF
jgi:very-short-patch-repair endonuclease